MLILNHCYGRDLFGLKIEQQSFRNEIQVQIKVWMEPLKMLSLNGRTNLGSALPHELSPILWACLKLTAERQHMLLPFLLLLVAIPIIR